jgi:hypothetical protein
MAMFGTRRKLMTQRETPEIAEDGTPHEALT